MSSSKILPSRCVPAPRGIRRGVWIIATMLVARRAILIKSLTARLYSNDSGQARTSWTNDENDLLLLRISKALEISCRMQHKQTTRERCVHVHLLVVQSHHRHLPESAVSRNASPRPSRSRIYPGGIWTLLFYKPIWWFDYLHLSIRPIFYMGPYEKTRWWLSTCSIVFRPFYHMIVHLHGAPSYRIRFLRWDEDDRWWQMMNLLSITISAFDLVVYTGPSNSWQ